MLCGLTFNVFCYYFAVIYFYLFVSSLIFFKWRYQYWKRRGIPYIEPSTPFGNLVSSVGNPTNLNVLSGKHYETFKMQGAKLGGLYFFNDPACLVVDIEYVKNVLVKDFHAFHSRGFYVDPARKIYSSVASADGTYWKSLRAKLTPTFSSGKIKMMFGTLVDCLAPLNKKLDELYQNAESVQVKDVVARYVTNVMVSSAFGVDCNCFEQENGPFTEHAKSFFAKTNWADIILLWAMKYPFLKNKFNVATLNAEARKFYTDVVRDTMKHRLQHNVKRNDFMEMMLQLMKEGALLKEEVFAQCIAFFIAGYETSANTSSSALYLLAKHPDIQKKVRREIATVLERHEGKITYEGVHEMKYLDQVISESQRLLPTAAHILRRCTEDYKFPDPEVTIKKGTLMAISIFGIHHDPDYFPDPEKFDPERFSPENKGLIRPFTFMPFGEGPRICIAARFALLQSKLAVIEILRTYRISVDAKIIEALDRKPILTLLKSHTEIVSNLHKD